MKANLWTVGVVYRLWRAHDFPVFLRIMRYYLSTELTGKWEPWLWEGVPTRGRTAIDAGANAGQWTLELAKTFDRVVAIEPNPTTAQKLQDRVPRNVSLVVGAAWNEAVYRPLIVYPDDRICRIVDHDLLYSMGKGHNGLEVPCFPIDGLELDNVDFLKLDVEGAEAEALEGALATIRASAPVILVELHSAKARERISTMLASLHYSWELRHYPFYNPREKLDDLRLWILARKI